MNTLSTTMFPTLDELVDFQQNKENIAVLYHNDNKEEIGNLNDHDTMTYFEMNEFACEISAALRLTIINNAACAIGIFMEPDVNLPAVILGILKASCYFVYMPSNESAAYIERLATCFGVNFVITTAAKKDSLANFRIQKSISRDLLICLRLDQEPPDSSRLSDDYGIRLAYAIRTSGSTSEPKIVHVPHQAIVSNIIDLKTRFAITSSDTIFLCSPLTFDPAIVDIFMTLSSGATLLIVPDKMKADSDSLLEILFRQYRITMLQATPSLFARFTEESIRNVVLSVDTSLRILVLGGESFPVDLIGRCWPQQNRLTKIFNIYGITEVSCWATCCEITREMISTGEISLGEPLLNTEIRIQKENGDLLSLDEKNEAGKLLIGGHVRRCFIGGELLTVMNHHRHQAANFCLDSGDLAKFNQYGQLIYLGRTDNQIKRLGKRINLDEISAIMKKCSFIRNAIVMYETETNLLLAVYTLTSTLVYNDNNNNDDVSSCRLNTLKSTIDAHLPNYSKPDEYYEFENLTLNSHGKIDRSKLFDEIKRRRASQFDEYLIGNSTNIEAALFGCIKSMINSNDKIDDDGDSMLTMGSNLCKLGLVNSFTSLRLITRLEAYFNVVLPEAFEIIYRKTVNDLLQYLKMTCLKSENISENLIRRNKRLSVVFKENESDDFGTKRKKIDFDANFHAPSLKDGQISEIRSNMKFCTEWQWNSGKCVDASPLLIEDKDGCRVYIGSHSGKFAALDALTGQVNWSVQLSGRVEASAIVTSCRRFIVVGCYDFCLYFLNISDGRIHWRFRTGDIIKNSGVCSKTDHVIYAGSHDGFFYALYHEAKRMKWKTNLNSGIVSSPCLDEESDKIFAATLRGFAYCLSINTGKVQWSFNVGKPVFASLVKVERILLVSSVDGCCHFLDNSSGSEIRTLNTDAPIFKAPCTFLINEEDPNHFAAIFCNQAGHILCYNYRTAEVKWYRNVAYSSISTTPCLFKMKPSTSRETGGDRKQNDPLFCCLATNTGVVYILDALSGFVYLEHKHKTTIFSSPVVWNERVYFGSRDDCLYCMKLAYDACDLT